MTRPPSLASPVLRAPFFPDFCALFSPRFGRRATCILRSTLLAAACSFERFSPAEPSPLLPQRLHSLCASFPVCASSSPAFVALSLRLFNVLLRPSIATPAACACASLALSPFAPPMRVSPPRSSPASDCSATRCTPLLPLYARALSALAAFLRVVACTSPLLPVLVTVRAPPPSRRCPALSSSCAVLPASPRASVLPSSARSVAVFSLHRRSSLAHCTPPRPRPSRAPFSRLLLPLCAFLFPPSRPRSPLLLACVLHVRVCLPTSLSVPVSSRCCPLCPSALLLTSLSRACCCGVSVCPFSMCCSLCRSRSSSLHSPSAASFLL